MPDQKVIITVAVNENQMRSSNPNVPISPKEIAEDSRRCANAGASIVHWHERDPETEASVIGDTELSIETLNLVSEASSIIPFATYADLTPVFDGHYEISRSAEFRYKHIVEGMRRGRRYELGNIDLQSAIDINAFRIPEAAARSEGGVGDQFARKGDIDGWLLSKGHNINSGEDHVWLCRFCEEHDIRKGFAVLDTVSFINLRNLIDMGLVSDPAILMYLMFASGELALATRLNAFLAIMREVLPTERLVWTPYVYGSNGLKLAALSLAQGGNVRVGIGDYPYPELDRPTNAELVERTVKMAHAVGREVATPDEARDILHLARRVDPQA